MPCSFICSLSESRPKIPPKIKEHIDLFTGSDHNLKSEIKELYFGKEFLEACKICNGRDHNVASIPAAEQTKSVLKLKKFN